MISHYQPPHSHQSRLIAGVCSANEWNYNDRVARKSLLQSGACQAGVNSCQVGLLAAPLPRARAAEGGPPHLFAPANHKCGNICPQTGMCSLSMATPGPHSFSRLVFGDFFMSYVQIGRQKQPETRRTNPKSVRLAPWETFYSTKTTILNNTTVGSRI